MEIKQKAGRLAGMSGWLIKGANISIAEDELELLKKIFRIEE